MADQDDMTQETSENEFKYYTQKAGDIARQLSFAGVAIVWLFHIAISDPSGTTKLGIPLQFQHPLLLFVLSLGLDAVQYLLGSILWGWAALDDTKSGAAYQIKPANVFAIAIPVGLIFAKLAIMIAAYVYLYEAIDTIITWQ